jgi:anti-sigma regulatory factor (Ser/Thr protein kinase)
MAVLSPWLSSPAILNLGARIGRAGDLARLAGLAEHEVAIPAPDDELRVLALVAGKYSELPWIGPDGLVLGDRQPNPLRAPWIRTLTHEVDEASVCTAQRLEILDPLVDPPEGTFVQRDSTFGFGHGGEHSWLTPVSEQRMTAVHRVELRLPAESAALGRAREAVSELGRLHPETELTLKLLVNELITNSIRHARLAAGEEVVVLLEVAPDRVRVEVIDHGVGFAMPEGEVESRRGFPMVQALSSRFGVTRQDATCSWFEIDLSPPPSD